MERRRLPKIMGSVKSYQEKGPKAPAICKTELGIEKKAGAIHELPLR
jgi:hypothetical protein